MAVQCPYCGHEYGGSGVPGGVAAFFERLDALDQQLFETEAAKEAKGSPGGAFGAMSSLAGVAKTLTGTSAGDKRKLEMIQNFPIPNSREDILEFIILASSRITAGPGIFTAINIADIRDADKYNTAWSTKIKQASAKAQIIFASDKQELRRIDTILKDANITPGKVKPVWFKFLIPVIAVVVFLIIVAVAAFIFDL
jgi:hypothetical protein